MVELSTTNLVVEGSTPAAPGHQEVEKIKKALKTFLIFGVKARRGEGFYCSTVVLINNIRVVFNVCQRQELKLITEKL